MKAGEPSGTTVTLRGIWGTDPNNLWVVGDGGTIRKWDGAGWTAQDSGVSYILNGVWIQQYLGAVTTLYGVWGASATNVWAVGSFGLAANWNGTSSLCHGLPRSAPARKGCAWALIGGRFCRHVADSPAQWKAVCQVAARRQARILLCALSMRHPVKTPPFRSAQGEVLPDSIAEVGYHRLGGVDQWVMIRGEHIANPALIILHGGPGLSEMGFFRYYNAPLEKCFTVIHWDQRGAGKSFDRSIPRSSMTVEQFITDLDQLVELLRQRLGTQRVVLFGHSWGSALGVLYAARFSEKVAAYIGCGQIGDAQAGEMASYVFALAEAERLHDSTAAQSLRAIGPPPHTADKLWVERRCLARLEGGASPWALLRMILRVPESSLFELPSTYRGFRFSLDAMWAEVSKLNLLEAAPALQMPVFFLLGRHDHWVPSQTSARYFDVLRAPVKQLVWFEESGHEPFVDEPAKFNATMVEFVRPTLA